jgi:Na+/melibiose symporter-like transporter
MGDEEQDERKPLLHEKNQTITQKTTLGQKPKLQPATFCSLSLLCCVSCGWAAVWMAMLVVLVPKQVGDLPGVGDKHKGKALGTVLLCAGVISIFEPPLVGWLSDNTRTRFGRRRVWIVAGTVGMCISMLFLAQCNTLGSLIGVFMLVQFFSNWSSTAFLALLPDVVPADQLGQASGFFAASCAVGQIIGAGSGAFASTVGIPRTYLYLVVFFLLMLCITVVSGIAQEDPHLGDYDKDVREEGGHGDGDGGLQDENDAEGQDQVQNNASPSCNSTMRKTMSIFAGSLLTNADFRWVWITRFLFNCGISIVQGFLQYFVADRIPLKGWDSTTLVSVLFVPIVVGAILFASVCGYLSDKWGGQRKIFVYVSGIVQILCAIALMFVTSFPLGMVIGFFFGAGFGTFTSVDLAMAVDVLRNDRLGRDLGIWYISAVIPQLIMTPLGGHLLDGVRAIYGVAAGYQSIYGMAALCMIVGTVLVRKIKGVK